MKFSKIFTVLVILLLSSCAELQQVVNQLPQEAISNADIASGLRQALNNGIDKQVTK